MEHLEASFTLYAALHLWQGSVAVDFHRLRSVTKECKVKNNGARPLVDANCARLLLCSCCTLCPGYALAPSRPAATLQCSRPYVRQGQLTRGLHSIWHVGDTSHSCPCFQSTTLRSVSHSRHAGLLAREYASRRTLDPTKNR